MQWVRDFFSTGREHSRIVPLILGVVLFAHIASYVYLAQLAPGNPRAFPHPLLRGDAAQYAELADILVSKGFAAGISEISWHWPPGYPVFLALVKNVSGLTGHEGWHLVVAIQVTLALFAVAFLYRMAREFLPPLWAAVPPLLYGLNPHVILHNTTTLSDGLFSSLLILIVYLAFFWNARGNELARWGAVGFLLGGMALMRPIALFLIPLGLVALALARGYRENLKAFIEPVVAYIAAASIILGPWLVSNHAKTGLYEVGHVSSINLLYYNVRDFLSLQEIRETRPMSAILVNRYRNLDEFKKVDVRIRERLQEMAGHDEGLQRYESAVALSFIRENAFEYARFHLAHLLPFFLASGIEEYQETTWSVAGDQGLFASIPFMTLESMWPVVAARDWGTKNALFQLAPVLLEMFGWACAVVLALYALFVRRALILWVFAGLVLYFALLTGPVSIARYRIPAEPYLLVLATIGAYALVERVRPPHSKSEFVRDMLARMKHGMLFFWAGVLFLVIAGIGMSVFVKPGPGQLDSFAQCLEEQGATFYGAFWCPHCQAQKRMFGKSASLLPYVECSTPDGQGQLQSCTDKEITQYPTWEFADGERLTGEVPLNQLAEKTGCVLPQ